MHHVNRVMVNMAAYNCLMLLLYIKTCKYVHGSQTVMCFLIIGCETGGDFLIHQKKIQKLKSRPYIDILIFFSKMLGLHRTSIYKTFYISMHRSISLFLQSYIINYNTKFPLDVIIFLCERWMLLVSTTVRLHDLAGWLLLVSAAAPL